MSRKEGRHEHPYVAIYRFMMRTPAWQALSVGARAAFFILKSNYNTKAQNSVYLAARRGAKELNAHKDTVRKWLRELEFYGFIVMVEGAHLGVQGTGKAARYRLTDSKYAGKSATYDFQNWDGVLFDPQKQNPVLLGRTPRPTGPDKGKVAEMTQIQGKCPTGPDKGNAMECPTKPDITSLTSSRSKRRLEVVRPQWSTPTVEEMHWSDYWAQVYGDMARVAV